MIRLAALLLTTLASPPDLPAGPSIRSTGRLGVLVQAVADDFVEANGLKDDERGLQLLEVQPDGPGAKAGLAANDVLLEIVEPGPARRLTETADLTSTLGTLNPGDTIALRVLRLTGAKRDLLVVRVVLG